MKKILIIEDNPDIRENVEEILTLAQYRVITAADGKEGVELAKAQRPDLIVCDIMMPILDGYGVLHVLQAEPETMNIPFIFLTSKSERSDFRAAMEQGADDYITKPFSATELLGAIESRFKKLEVLKSTFTSGLEGLNQLLSVAHQKSLDELAQNSHVNTYKKRQQIYTERNHPHYLYYILSGKVKTFRTHEDGKDLVVGLYNAGDFFGYVALLEGGTYKETAEAMEETELALIPKKDFEDLVNSNPDMMRKLIALLASNLAEREKQLLGIAYNTLRKKVAQALVTLQKKYHTEKDTPYLIDISRDELATIAGTATESLIRTLSDFRTEQLIDIKSGKITVLNEKKLEHLMY
jgi:CRP/FNR family transcriptional regulator, cyclic AMP receptor protein